MITSNRPVAVGTRSIWLAIGWSGIGFNISTDKENLHCSSSIGVIGVSTFGIVAMKLKIKAKSSSTYRGWGNSGNTSSHRPRPTYCINMFTV